MWEECVRSYKIEKPSKAIVDLHRPSGGSVEDQNADRMAGSQRPCMNFQRGTRTLGTGLEVISAIVWKRRLGGLERWL